MRVQDHPEYEMYQRDAALVATCRRSVATWIADGKPLTAPDGVMWTPRRAREFVEEVGHLFQQYNLVLWQTFSYCRRCAGGCCVTGASQVTVFDALALALLAQPFPELAQRAGAGDCIYLGAQGCRWPRAWRPIKCWSFYCLGSGDWELDAADARYARITEALEEVVRQHLPGYLRRQEKHIREPLHQFLTDPIAFAEALGAALFDIFVAPFAEAYGAGELQTFTSTREKQEDTWHGSFERAQAFIASAAEQLWQDGAEPTADGARLLQDLERLEWILLQRQPSANRELRALFDRYGRVDENGTSRPVGAQSTMQQQMAEILRQLLQQSDA